MERFKVEGAELRQHYNDRTPLGRVFLDIERELRLENKVVCRYIVNGLNLSEKEEERFAQFLLSEVQTLEYLCESEDELTRSVIQAWLDALPELIGASEKLALEIIAGRREGLIKAVHDLVENCEYLLQSLASIQQIRGDDKGNETFNNLKELTRQALSEALRHLESRDFVQLAQVIEYDFTHSLEEWKRALAPLLFFGGSGGTGDIGQTNEHRDQKNHHVGGKPPQN